MCLCVGLCTYTCMQVLHESEEGPGSPEAGVTGGCELLLGTGNQFGSCARTMCVLSPRQCFKDYVL